VRDQFVVHIGEHIADFIVPSSHRLVELEILFSKVGKVLLHRLELSLPMLNVGGATSPYCMTELYSVYQNAPQERQEFLNRIIPLVLKDANNRLCLLPWEWCNMAPDFDTQHQIETSRFKRT
jgi:hypothetical protein